MNKPEPTPWGYTGNIIRVSREVGNHQQIRDIGRMQNQDDTEFVVRAVNSHGYLLKALKALHDLHPCEAKYRRLCDIDAIIAKAEGK